jgi:hypothetical protein
MRTQCYRTLEIVLLGFLVIGSVGVPPVFAKDARGHVCGKSAARSAESSAKPALGGENTTQGPAKAHSARTAVTRGADKPSDIDARISVQPQLLRKSVNPNRSVAQNPYHRRTLSVVPRIYIPPVRNAIGLPVPPPGDLGSSTGLHPRNLPGSPSVGSTRIGGTAARVPHSTSNVVSPEAGRGAISGTGLANRRLGPPQIGGPKAVAGINGTTIKRTR